MDSENGHVDANSRIPCRHQYNPIGSAVEVSLLVKRPTFGADSLLMIPGTGHKYGAITRELAIPSHGITRAPLELIVILHQVKQHSCCLNLGFIARALSLRYRKSQRGDERWPHVELYDFAIGHGKGLTRCDD